MLRKCKHILKNAVSFISYYSSKVLADSKDKGGFRILLYHSIGDKKSEDSFGIRVSKGDFFEQMKYLNDNKFNVLRLSDLVKIVRNNEEIPQRSIAITFDDGYKDNLIEAVPVLKKFNFPATFFICVDYLELKKKEHSNDYWSKWVFLSKEDLRYLFDFEIGLHSMTHRRLISLNANEIMKEIGTAKLKLEDYINKSINLYSYPHGEFSNSIISALKKSGFICACCSIPGNNNSKVDLYKLKRTEIVSGDNILEFKKKLDGYYDILRLFKN